MSADSIVRVLHVFGRMDRGGAELRTVELAESFAGRRVRSDFLVLTGLDGPLDERVRRAGGEVIKCSLNAGFPLAFYKLLRARRYDVVHSHVHYFSGAVLALARLAGTPGRIAHFRAAVVNDKRSTIRRRAQLALCRRLIDLVATDILAVGEGTMGGAWSNEWREDPRCRVIHNGIASARLHSTRPADKRAPTIVNVASLQPRKNQLRALKVFKQCLHDLPDLQLWLVGREIADYGEIVRRAVCEAGLADRVHFLGDVDDPIPLIAAADLMILPSLWEGVPGAALEACALGVPVLASDLPGNRELARHFSSMTIRSLEEDDHTWAAEAVRLIAAGRTDAVEVTSSLAASPFNLDRSRETYYAIWSRARASA